MKRILQVLGIIVILIIAAALILPFVIDANQFRPRVESALTDSLGRQVKVGDLKLALLQGGVTASDLSIADDPVFSRSPFLTATSLKIGVELSPLIFSRKLNVTGVDIVKPQIVLIQNKAGMWNFSTMGAKPAAQSAATPAPAPGHEAATSAPLQFTVKLLKISDGRVSMQRAGDPKPQALEKLNLEVRDFAPSATFPFSLSANINGGGDLKLDGKAGPIDNQDVSETPFSAALKIRKLNPIASGFLRPSTGISGIVSLDADAVSNGKQLNLKGTVDVEQLKLVAKGTPAKKVVGFDFVIDNDLVRRAGVLQSGTVRIGKAKASLTGDYRMEGNETFLNMKLAAPAMDVEELEAMLPALNVVLPMGSSLKGGTAHANLTVNGPVDKIVGDGNLGLSKTQLVGFDLGSKMRAMAAIVGINIAPNTDFETVSSDVHYGPEGTAAKNVLVIATGIGQLTGNGTISPTNELDFKMLAKLTTSGGVLGAAGSKITTIPFSIKGTSSDPKFIADVKGLATGLLEGASGFDKEKLKNVKPEDAGKAASDIINLFKGKKPKQ